MASEKKINGTVYRFDQLTGWEAWDALQILIKVAGPFAPLLSAIGAEDDKRMDIIARLVPDLISKHDSAATRDLLERLLANCRVDGNPVVVGVRPATLDEMFAVFAFCLEAQFAGFFGGSAVKSLMAMLPADDQAA